MAYFDPRAEVVAPLTLILAGLTRPQQLPAADTILVLSGNDRNVAPGHPRRSARRLHADMIYEAGI